MTNICFNKSTQYFSKIKYETKNYANTMANEEINVWF